jgi:hypothetical protein
MKKILIICLLVVTNIYAHTLIMNILDNEDNTITIVGEFSTGQKAVDAMIRLEALSTGNILFMKRLPDVGELTLDIPKEPYQVVLDGGPGHQIVRKGLAPISGYNLESTNNTTERKELSQAITAKNSWSLAYIILISITLLLILLSIYVSKRNTDKILKMIDENC